ncbi:MAG: VTT domain-containing protein [Minisyncoccia bacterium]
MNLFISSLIGGAIGSTALLSLAIILGIILLEDTTIVITGLLAADGFLAAPLALFSLYIGVIVSDIVFYSIGRFASSHPRFARYVDHEFVAPFRAWLENRFILTIFSARFIPGSRIPLYAASGFFRSSFPTFITTTTAASAVWTTILFSGAYWFGNITAGWMGPVRWGIALLFLLTLFLIGRHNLLAYRAKKEELSNAVDIRE